MYKSSGKKYKGSRETSSGKYRSSAAAGHGYNSDVYSDEFDEESVYDNSMINSPDFYSASGKSHGSNSYYQSSSAHGHGKSNNNYYNPSAKSSDHYYSSSTPKSDYYGHSNYSSGGNYLPSSHGKHKGKDSAYKLNKYQTIVLKVQIHCDACIKKVKKAIADVDGVESITVDQKQKKVTVTGYIDPKKVLKKVAKTGKSVELVGGSSIGGKDALPHHFQGNNKSAISIMAAASDRHHHPTSNLINSAAANNVISTMKPYTVQVEKSSRSNVHSTMPHYIHMAPPQLRSDVDYLFSDDNANNCSIM